MFLFRIAIYWGIIGRDLLIHGKKKAEIKCLIKDSDTKGGRKKEKNNRESIKCWKGGLIFFFIIKKRLKAKEKMQKHKKTPSVNFLHSP